MILCLDNLSEGELKNTFECENHVWNQNSDLEPPSIPKLI